MAETATATVGPLDTVPKADGEGEQPAPQRGGVTFGRLFGLARPEASILVIATAALLISSGLGLVYPVAVQWMIESISGDQPPIDFDTAAILLVVLFAIQSVFGMVRAWLFTVAGERVVARLRTQLYAAILGQDISFFDKSRTGELTNRLASDTTVLQNTVTVNMSMGLRFTAQAIGAVIMLLVMSRELTGLAMLVVPVVAVGAAFYGRWIQRLSKEVQDALAASTEVAEESISGLRTVRSFAREHHEVERYGNAVDKSYRLAARRALVTGMFGGTAGFAGYCAVALVVWYGGNLVLEGGMTVGELIAFLLYTLTVAFSIGALSGLYGDFMRAIGASERVFQLIDQTPKLERTGGRVLESMEGRLRLDDVHFHYPTRPDMPVLQGLDVSIAPGQVVALVGPSGSGKSTVASLLVRFYDPDQGTITIDGVDLRELDTQWWREQIGLVSQEPVLFATSIAENIRYGRPDASDEALRKAAEAANALGFVESFPEGFETLVGERGVQLSGGQKQRIAIARAILKDPRFLVLDEATSALDSESEHLVQEALDRLMEGRTTLVIAHRLSTIRDADEVVVLDGGQVAERGRHEDLMQTEGIYRRLVERQSSNA